MIYHGRIESVKNHQLNTQMRHGHSSSLLSIWPNEKICYQARWMFPKIRVPPTWMAKIMETPIKMDDLGVPSRAPPWFKASFFFRTCCVLWN